MFQAPVNSGGFSDDSGSEALDDADSQIAAPAYGGAAARANAGSSSNSNRSQSVPPWGGLENAAAGVQDDPETAEIIANWEERVGRSGRLGPPSEAYSMFDGDSEHGIGLDDDAMHFPGFDAAIMKTDEAAQPFITASDPEKIWRSIPSFSPGDLRPKRAMVINVPCAVFSRNASSFHEWQLLTGSESRCYATAALVSALFAGYDMGIPSGRHEENEREMDTEGGESSNQGGKKKKALKQVSRYYYIPPDPHRGSWPMFQIALEELFNSDKTEVVALRVWLFVYEETHSTSHVLRRVMRESEAQLKSQSATGETSSMRNRDAASEASRLSKCGLSIEDLTKNFEGTVGMQFKRIYNLAQWQQMLQLHSGKTSCSSGRPCVADMQRHISCPAGSNTFQGDDRCGYGGLHPLAPEWVLNAKREEALAFGLVDFEGNLLDVCDEQLTPSSYFALNGSDFRIPALESVDRTFFFINTQDSKNSPFRLPLPRSLQGGVIPGEPLVKLFLERELRAARAAKAASAAGATSAHDEDDEGDEDDEIDLASLKIDDGAYARMRTMATEKDESLRLAEARLQDDLRSYDFMTASGGAAPVKAAVDSGADVSIVDANGEQTYIIQTVNAATKVSRETDALYGKMIKPWQQEEKRKLKNLHSKLVDLLENGKINEDGDEFEAYYRKYEKNTKRFYDVKKALTEYHLRLLRGCFMSKADSATLPAGHRAMFRALEDGVRKNGGSGSVAFGPCDGSSVGRQQVCDDRTSFGAMQEWLTQILSKDCKIAGRDSHLMKEMYFSAQEVFSAGPRFILIIAGPKGQGKSVRAVRLCKIMPPGWCTRNSASSARSGMNGNNSPSNGTLVFHDEMPEYMTPNKCTERMEMKKTTCSLTEYVSERTIPVKNRDGNDSHKTCQIKTDHKQADVISTNMGNLFTINGEPDSGKRALIQRTLTLTARAETDRDSPESEFEENLKRPDVARRIEDFRLFTAHVGYVKHAIMNTSWLQPDESFAKLLWRQGDRILEEEYGLTKPEPRRLARRTENLRTLCAMLAVWQVFMTKQTACNYEAGRPNPETGGGKKFEVADYWDVIRTLHPTREMIVWCWSVSLEYSIGTSSQGCNVMSAICEKLGFSIDNAFRQIPNRTAGDLDRESVQESKWNELEAFMNEVKNGKDDLVGVGADARSLDQMLTHMEKTRKTRNKFRSNTIGHEIADKLPMDAIKQLYPDESEALQVSNALFPNMRMAAQFYKVKTLLRWAVGKTVLVEDAQVGRGECVRFKDIPGNGGPKKHDYAWIVLTPCAANGQVTWRGFCETIKNTPSCLVFDMHEAGIADCGFMLASDENKRVVPGMPQLPFTNRASQAFVDESGETWKESALQMGLRPVTLPNGRQGAAHQPENPWKDRDRPGRPLRLRVRGDDVDPIPADSSEPLVQHNIDNMLNNGRLPALVAHTSTALTREPPLRKIENSGIEVNTVVVMEHVLDLLEAALRMYRVKGCKGHERLASGGAPPTGLSAQGVESESTRQRNASAGIQVVKQLPYSIDLQQMAWTVDFANRFYDPTLVKELELFNDHIGRSGLGEPIQLQNMPQMSLKYMGFPQDPHASAGEALRHISLPLQSEKPEGQEEVEVSTADDVSKIPKEALRYECEVSLGRPVDDGDIEEYIKGLLGGSFTNNVEGDMFSYKTFVEHSRLSMIARGNFPDVCVTEDDTSYFSVYAKSKEDTRNVYADPAFEGILYSEHMLLERLLERRCEHEAGMVLDEWEERGELHALKISKPGGSTYSYLEKNRVDASQTSRGHGNNGKRKYVPPESRNGRKNPRSSARMDSARSGPSGSGSGSGSGSASGENHLINSGPVIRRDSRH